MSVRDEVSSFEPGTLAMLVLMVGAGGAGVALVAGLRVWAWITGATLPAGVGPLLRAVAGGQVPLTAGVWACVVAVALCVLLVVVVARRVFGMGRGTRADKAASRTGRAADTRALSAKEVARKARRLGVQGGGIGLPIGRAVAGGRPLWSSFEDVCLVIAGPRTGKTTSWVVPRIFAAPGAVVATSNKRDVVVATRERRSAKGRVWVFDPQGLADEPQTWWWNPLSYVTDAVKARAMTEAFVDATRDPKAQSNAFFDAASRDLVAALLLAAARGNRPLGELHRWLNDQSDGEPVRLLREAGEIRTAETLEGTQALVPETRSGVYGGAATIMSFLLNEQAMAWVTPSPWVEELRPERFVASTDTLYLLSQEGPGSAYPIVTALTVAVTEAALAYAKSQPGGRLACPMLIELDEAANVCRWRQLPDLYSHFGSRGICVDTILQSWSQGAQAWGEAGIRKLWSAANVAVYGGGVKEKAFLGELSDLIGTHWLDSRQRSYGRQGRSVSVSTASQARPIASVADLQGLPPGRAWVLASGSTALLAALVPYWKNQDTDGRRGR